jgi:hypothetical protein
MTPLAASATCCTEDRPAAGLTPLRSRTTSMPGPLRLGSGWVMARWNAAGPKSFETSAPVPIEGWRAPALPIAGRVASPTIRSRVGGMYTGASVGLP